ncbi:amidohydrolase family protein [Desulfotignum balticum]|uniref:amidohydrolase family protein n=1 Tax=Desulfotignum balticum TaxID=115781 RepID=UPI0003FDD18F|nr:amidohydrolase family protein [Desulfotignum balticum]
MKSFLELNSKKKEDRLKQAEAFYGAIVDVHHHILPQAYLEALADSGVHQSIGVLFPDWTIEKDLKTMDRLGIKRAILSFSSPGANVPGIENARNLARFCNDFMAQTIKAQPGRYGAFATLPPLEDLSGALKELEYAMDELALDGVALSSNYDLKYLGDASFEPVHKALNARNAVVHVHPTDPPGVQFGIPAAVMDAPFDATRAAVSLICSGVMERYPDITFILSHGGGVLPYLSYRIGKMVPHIWKSFTQNAPKGFDKYLNQFYYDSAIVGPDAFPCLIKHAGASRVIFGTDYPFAGRAVPAECLEAIQNFTQISCQNRYEILEKNASALFPRLCKIKPPLAHPLQDRST